MRILHAYKVYRPDIEGGVPAVISTLTEDPNSHFEQIVLCARRRGGSRSFVIDGVHVDAVGSFGTLFSTPVAASYIPAFVRTARSVDIVVHHAPFPLNDAAILSGLSEDTALIVYWHAEIMNYTLLRTIVSPMIRRVLGRADRIVVSGKPMVEHSKFLQPFAAKCAVIPFGMDLAYWRSPMESDRARIAAMQRVTPRHVIALGRLVPYKGFDVLIRAISVVDGNLTIVGEGPMLAPLQRLAKELSVADRVRFAGRLPRNEIRMLFHAAQVFAFPSVTAAEAFGLAQVEAMATGLPVVNTCLASTVPLVARDGIEALTVPPGDAAALATALTRILDSPDLACRLGAAGQARAQSEFDQAVFRSRMAALYDAVLTDRGQHAVASTDN